MHFNHCSMSAEM